MKNHPFSHSAFDQNPQSSICPSNSCTSFEDYAALWLSRKQQQIKTSTYQKYRNTLALHLIPFFGNDDLFEIDPTRMDAFIDLLLHEKKLSSKSIRDILTVFKSIRNFAASREIRTLVPLEVLVPRTPASGIRVLSPQEQALLVSELQRKEDPCRFGILLALQTGVRIGELCALQWKHISLTEKTLHITGTMQRLKDYSSGSEQTVVVISEPKTTGSVRSIPLNNKTADLCERFAADPEAYILTGSERYMEPRLLQYHFKRIACACGLEDIHFHTLRHTFATRCIEADFDVKCLSEILGHSSVKITLDRYVHASMDLKRKNMSKMEDLFI